MADKTRVTRIKASDSKPEVTAKAAKTKAAEAEPKAKKSKGSFKILKSISGYFVGAWAELRQVRWPTRKATWGLTLAVILFSAFFTAMILLLDMLFKSLFEIIIA